MTFPAQFYSAPPDSGAAVVPVRSHTVSLALELPIRLTEARIYNLNPVPAAHYANDADRAGGALMKVSCGSVLKLLECCVHTSGVTGMQVNCLEIIHSCIRLFLCTLYIDINPLLCQKSYIRSYLGSILVELCY